MSSDTFPERCASTAFLWFGERSGLRIQGSKSRYESPTGKNDFVPPTIDTTGYVGHDYAMRTSSRRRAGAEVENGFIVFQDALSAPSSARASGWMRERPINFAV
jgi:hypothetical protein